MHEKSKILKKLFPPFLKLARPGKGQRATSDTFILADFVLPLSSGDRVVDLGTGSGAIAIYLCAKTKDVKITGVEIEPGVAELATRNIKDNGLGRRVRIINRDWRELYDVLPAASFTHVVCNPPYMKKGAGRLSPDAERRVARHESAGTMEDLIKVSRHLAGTRGRIFYIYPVARFGELVFLLHMAGLKPRRLRLVYTGKNKKVNLFVIEAGVQGVLKIESPVYL